MAYVDEHFLSTFYLGFVAMEYGWKIRYFVSYYLPLFGIQVRIIIIQISSKKAWKLRVLEKEGWRAWRGPGPGGNITMGILRHDSRHIQVKIEKFKKYFLKMEKYLLKRNNNRMKKKLTPCPLPPRIYSRTLIIVTFEIVCDNVSVSQKNTSYSLLGFSNNINI